jgi:hypothetical protein
MRYFVLSLVMIIFSFFMQVERKFMEMEFIVFEMYTTSFEMFLSVDEYSNLYFKKKEIKNFIEEKGYDARIYGDLNFVVSFDLLFHFEKEFSFYLEGCYEF